MAGIKRFEDIRAWQLAKSLTNSIYHVTRKGEFAKDFALRDQIRRAAGSTMHNIAEGFDAGSDMEFIRFLRYSLRSATEVQSQLHLALDQSYIEQSKFDQLYQAATHLKASIQAFVNYLSGDKGSVREAEAEYVVDFDDSQIVA